MLPYADFINAVYENTLTSLLLFVSAVLFIRWLRKPKLNLPPGPKNLPLVGYLPYLDKEPFKIFDALSKKYGNVFSVYLGQSYFVILGDYVAIKEALSKKETLDRPHGIFDFQPDQFGISSSNGQVWVGLKRFTMRAMRDIGFGRSKWEELLEEEISEILTLIEDANGHPIDMGEILDVSMSNNIASLVFGKRIPKGKDRDAMNTAISSVMEFFAQSSVWNYYPWICKILLKLKVGRYQKYFEEMKAFNAFVRKEVDLHKKQSDDSEEQDFINSFFSHIQNKQDKYDDLVFTQKNLIGTSQALFVAGSETSRTSSLWLLLAMAAYPNIQKKIHFELDSVLGRNRKAVWEDRSKLPYTYAAIMEVQRWKTVAPLGLARLVTEDIKICGYDVPKGTTIFPNLWGIHNDTRYWKDPEEYIPERFLQNGGKEVNLKLESYMPFSYGKRRCPGETVAMMEIFLYFTAIMQIYEVQAPNGGRPNLEALSTLTYQPVYKTMRFVPR